ncbi:MAG: hypothetical protein HDP28_01690 [Clostridia bacterium]|nr:hypothetical protein [Clostridia bacterium]
MKKRWLLIVAFISLLFAAIFTACGEQPVKYKISVEGVQGGHISLSATEAAAGETVTITCTPDDGFMFRESSLEVNGEPLEGYSFVMPAKDVVVTGEFVSTNYQGTYLYYGFHGSGNAYVYEFIQVGESTLTVGVTYATVDANYDCEIYENVPYEVNRSKITATVNGEAWSAEIGNGKLSCGSYEYELCEDVTLSGTYTEIADANADFWVRNYTFTNGTLVITTDYDGSTETENATYKQFGSFLYIEFPDTTYATNRIEYGVLNVHEDYLAFLHNYRYEDMASSESLVNYSVLALYPKSTQITLKTNGAYVFKEETDCFSGEKEGTPACYDFLSLTNDELTFSRHGAYFDKDLHYFGADTAFVRVGNVLRVSYTLTGNNVKLTFHIINENLMILKDSLDSVQKFVFTENSSFTGGHGAKYSNTEWATMDYYENGKFGTNKYDNNGTLLETNEYGSYHVYGNLLVLEQNGGAVRIGVIEEQPAGSECDYLYRYKRIEWDDSCDSERETTERIWKEAA